MWSRMSLVWFKACYTIIPPHPPPDLYSTSQQNKRDLLSWYHFPVFVPLLKCFIFSGMSPRSPSLSFLGHWNPTHLSRLISNAISNLHEVFLDLVQQAWLIRPLSTSYGDFVPPLWGLSHFTVICLLVFSFLLNYTLFGPVTRSHSLLVPHGISTQCLPNDGQAVCKGIGSQSSALYKIVASSNVVWMLEGANAHWGVIPTSSISMGHMHFYFHTHYPRDLKTSVLRVVFSQFLLFLCTTSTMTHVIKKKKLIHYFYLAFA